MDGEVVSNGDGLESFESGRGCSVLFCVWNELEEEMVPFARVEGFSDSAIAWLQTQLPKLVEDHLVEVNYLGDDVWDQPENECIKNFWHTRVYRFSERELRGADPFRKWIQLCRLWEDGVQGEGYFEELKRLRQECLEMIDDLRKSLSHITTDAKRRSDAGAESRTHELVKNNQPGHPSNPAVIHPTAQLSAIPSYSDQRSETFVTENDGADVPFARHSVDFASVHWYGTDYIFTPNQAACVKVLWDAWKNKSPVLFGTTILTEADIDPSGGRLDLVFRDNKAWGELVISQGKGRYRLAQPPQ